MSIDIYKLYGKYFHIYPNLLINNFFSSFVLLVFFISGYFELTAEIGVVSSLTILICHLFSGNLRSIIIADKNIFLADEMLLKRIILALPIIIIVIFFIYKNNLSDISLAFSISLVVILGWVFELILTKFEIKKKFISALIHLIFSLIFSLLILIFGLFKNLFYLKISIYLYVIFLIILILMLLKLNIKNFQFVKKNKSFLLDFFKINFISSISMSLSNFLFRYFLILFISKELAGILFACFMIGSFPGSLFNQVIGATIISKNISLRKILYPMFIFSLIIILYLSTKIPLEIFVNSSNFLINDKQIIIYLTLFFSIIGLNFMIIALYFRQKNIFSNVSRENSFIVDMYYSLSIILIVPTIYLIFGTNEIYYSIGFLISSILALIFYISPTINLKQRKIFKFLITIILIPFFIVYYDQNLKFYLISFDFIDSITLDSTKNRLSNFLIFLPVILYLGLKNIGNKIISTSYVLTAILCITSLNLFRNQVTIETHLNLVQILIPMTFLILGDLFFKKQDNIFIFYLYSFSIFFAYIVTCNVLTFIDFEIFRQYSSIVSSKLYHTQTLFILFFSFFSLIKILKKKINKYILNFYIINLLIFCIMQSGAYLNLAIIFLYLYIFFVYTNKKSTVLFSIIFIISIFFNYQDIGIVINTFTDSFIFYLINIFSNLHSILFGFNYFNEMYEIQAASNFYLDFIYNFGLLGLMPLLFLIIHTIKKIKSPKSGYLNFDMISFIFFILVFPSFTLSLGDIFIGSIVYLHWSILLKKNDKNYLKENVQVS
tara:strand:- start:3420 stop:5750 length:2331 start_codon:yes stop_codon:yes gene_type:complete